MSEGQWPPLYITLVAGEDKVNLVLITSSLIKLSVYASFLAD